MPSNPHSHSHSPHFKKKLNIPVRSPLPLPPPHGLLTAGTSTRPNVHRVLPPFLKTGSSVGGNGKGKEKGMPYGSEAGSGGSIKEKAFNPPTGPKSMIKDKAKAKTNEWDQSSSSSLFSRPPPTGPKAHKLKSTSSSSSSKPTNPTQPSSFVHRVASKPIPTGPSAYINPFSKPPKPFSSFHRPLGLAASTSASTSNVTITSSTSTVISPGPSTSQSKPKPKSKTYQRKKMDGTSSVSKKPSMKKWMEDVSQSESSLSSSHDDEPLMKSSIAHRHHHEPTVAGSTTTVKLAFTSGFLKKEKDALSIPLASAPPPPVLMDVPGMESDGSLTSLPDEFDDDEEEASFLNDGRPSIHAWPRSNSSASRGADSSTSFSTTTDEAEEDDGDNSSNVAEDDDFMRKEDWEKRRRGGRKLGTWEQRKPGSSSFPGAYDSQDGLDSASSSAADDEEEDEDSDEDSEALNSDIGEVQSSSLPNGYPNHHHLPHHTRSSFHRRSSGPHHHSSSYQEDEDLHILSFDSHGARLPDSSSLYPVSKGGETWSEDSTDEDDLEALWFDGLSDFDSGEEERIFGAALKGGGRSIAPHGSVAKHGGDKRGSILPSSGMMALGPGIIKNSPGDETESEVCEGDEEDHPTPDGWTTRPHPSGRTSSSHDIRGPQDLTTGLPLSILSLEEALASFANPAHQEDSATPQDGNSPGMMIIEDLDGQLCFGALGALGDGGSLNLEDPLNSGGSGGVFEFATESEGDSDGARDAEKWEGLWDDDDEDEDLYLGDEEGDTTDSLPDDEDVIPAPRLPAQSMSIPIPIPSPASFPSPMDTEMDLPKPHSPVTVVVHDVDEEEDIGSPMYDPSFRPPTTAPTPPAITHSTTTPAHRTPPSSTHKMDVIPETMRKPPVMGSFFPASAPAGGLRNVIIDGLSRTGVQTPSPFERKRQAGRGSARGRGKGRGGSFTEGKKRIKQESKTRNPFSPGPTKRARYGSVPAPTPSSDMRSLRRHPSLREETPSSPDSELPPINLEDVVDSSFLYHSTHAEQPLSAADHAPNSLHDKSLRNLSRWDRIPIGTFRGRTATYKHQNHASAAMVARAGASHGYNFSTGNGSIFRGGESGSSHLTVQGQGTARTLTSPVMMPFDSANGKKSRTQGKKRSRRDTGEFDGFVLE